MARIYSREFILPKFDELCKEAEKLKVESSLTESQRLHSLFTTYKRCLIIGCGVQAA